MVKLGGEPPLHIGPYLAPNTQMESPFANIRQIPRGLPHGVGAAGEGDNDIGTDMDILRRRRDLSQGHEWIVGRFVGPYAVVSDPFAHLPVAGGVLKSDVPHHAVDLHDQSFRCRN